MPRRVRATGARDDASAPAAAAPGPADGSDGSTDSSTDGSADRSTAGSAAGRPSDGSSAAAGNDASAAAVGDDAAAGRYYSATGMWRLPGAVPRRRRRAAVLQGARLRRVLKRGRGDRHVPILRRGPVAGGLFQRRAIAVAGGLLQRRGDRARAFEELGVIRKQYLETIVN